jgi:hypothetical protein
MTDGSTAFLGQDERALLDDKDAFVERLAEALELRDVIVLLLTLGLRYSDLALALNVHPRTVRAWIEDQERDLGRQRDGILELRALVLFLLRRSPLGPSHIAFWLVEPHEALDFRRPLAVFAEGGLDTVVKASRSFASFVQPEPLLPVTTRVDEAVAAGAVGREREGVVRTPGHRQQPGS